VRFFPRSYPFFVPPSPSLTFLSPQSRLYRRQISSSRHQSPPHCLRGRRCSLEHRESSSGAKLGICCAARSAGWRKRYAGDAVYGKEVAGYLSFFPSRWYVFFHSFLSSSPEKAVYIPSPPYRTRLRCWNGGRNDRVCELGGRNADHDPNAGKGGRCPFYFSLFSFPGSKLTLLHAEQDDGGRPLR
jgi:hypothetical protein